MSDVKNEIVIKESQHIKYIDENLSLIQNQNQLSDGDLKNFAIQCKRTGLDPITRQIYAIPNNGKMTIMASIDGLRLIADRSGLYEGQTEPMWCGQDGKWVDVWIKKETPTACKIGVHKKNFRQPLYAVALFEEYAGRYGYDDKYGKYKKGDLTFMWAKMPALMIAKVAEALALRKAFPNEMSGIYSTEEMDQSTNTEPRSVSPVVQNIEQKPESKAADILNDNPFDSYVINLGAKNRMTGTKLTDHTREWIEKSIKSTIDWHKQHNKQFHANTKEFVDMATAYLNSLPSVDTSENIPF